MLRALSLPHLLCADQSCSLIVVSLDGHSSVSILGFYNLDLDKVAFDNVGFDAFRFYVAICRR